MQSIVSLLLIVETLRSAMHIFFNLIIAALVFNPASQQKHPRVIASDLAIVDMRLSTGSLQDAGILS